MILPDKFKKKMFIAFFEIMMFSLYFYFGSNKRTKQRRELLRLDLQHTVKSVLCTVTWEIQILLGNVLSQNTKGPKMTFQLSNKADSVLEKYFLAVSSNEYAYLDGVHI